ncbi:Uncharacterised protein [Bordetella ansorpii]|uniref:Uncharacterized protein n=1 Tax=Bordetella ansorpii TaxID=288768 RepID=A0A157SW86_9BORD|nr:hypothetical protein [Bordetella ansorpii]SAI74604.1 Uncharacterised protein [Bordetella ansorpii]
MKTDRWVRKDAQRFATAFRDGWTPFDPADTRRLIEVLEAVAAPAAYQAPQEPGETETSPNDLPPAVAAVVIGINTVIRRLERCDTAGVLDVARKVRAACMAVGGFVAAQASGQPAASAAPRRIGQIRLDARQHPRAVLETGYDEQGNQWVEGTPIYAAPVAALQDSMPLLQPRAEPDAPASSGAWNL